MGVRNYLGRTLLLLAIALAVGIAVAIMGGDERARTGQSGSAPVIERPVGPYAV
ncbi:MAG TPA: hypothetical protein VE592_03215 [Geminicoccaceae bacterium]|nr:hypothetical protein [Geminicoccaceae bacterium]HZA65929.1 hypothetical protein [Geminicoccaceae bacterium]